MGKVAKTADRKRDGEAVEQVCPKCGKSVRVVKRIRNRAQQIAGGMYISCSACEYAEKL